MGENLFHQIFNIESIAGLGDSFIHAVKGFSYLELIFIFRREVVFKTHIVYDGLRRLITNDLLVRLLSFRPHKENESSLV